MRVNGAAAATAAGSTRSRPGLTIRKPLVMGTYAFRLSQAEKRRHNDMTHKWTCLLRSPDGEDLTYFIKKVVFELDPSFVNPRRTLTSPPYEVSEAGWGEFYLTARIYLVDETLPPVEMMHFLRLNLPGAPQGPCVASETYDELLIYEPADWLYEKLTATPVTDAPPHPLSPYFMQPSDSEEKQLQLYLGLQGYVQTESIALMQEAFLLTLQIQELQRQHEAITKGGGGAAAGAGAGAAAAAATSEGDGGEDAAAAAPGTPGPSGGFAAAVPDVAAVSGRPAAAGFGPSLGPVALTAQASPVSRGASIAAPAAYGSPKSPQLAAGPDPQQQPHVLPSIQPPQQHLMQQHQQHQMLQQQQLLQQQQQHMLQQQQHHMMQQQQHYLPKPPPHPAAPTQQQQQVLQQQQMG